MRVAVVGAGISGLYAAYTLQNEGCEVVVFERSNRVGGRMYTKRQEGFSWDTGAQFMLESYSHMKQLLHTFQIPIAKPAVDPILGIGMPNDAIYYLNMKRPWSLYKHPVLSKTSKSQLAWLVLQMVKHHRHLRFPYLDKSASIDSEIDLLQWAQQYVGKDVVDYVLSIPSTALFFYPIKQTPWWLTLLFTKLMLGWKFFSPVGGMDVVPQALANRLNVQLQSHVQSIRIDSSSHVTIQIQQDNHLVEYEADKVVLAVPTPVLIQMLVDPIAMLGSAKYNFLRQVQYVSNATTAVAFDTAPEAKAYGLVMPEALHRKIAVMTWEHLKDKERVPEGRSIGIIMPTAAYSNEIWGSSDDTIAKDMLSEIDRIYPGISKESRFTDIQRWEHAIPLIHPGFMRQLVELFGGKQQVHPSIVLCGDYFLGPGTEQALVTGFRAAQEVLRR